VDLNTNVKADLVMVLVISDYWLKANLAVC